jgi:hypothetical protein
MLALFQPWRSGYDLKERNQSWDDAFTSYNFSKRQNDIMDNFNLRYECMDARDDFHAQLKNGEAILPGWDSYKSTNGFDEKEDSGTADDDALQAVTTSEFDVEDSIQGKREQRRQRELATMNNVMQQTGWTVLLALRQLSSFKMPSVVLTASQWKTAIKDLRQKILQNQTKATSDLNSTVTELGQADPFQNQVRLVDKSYLERSKSSAAQTKVRDAIVQKFRLNYEQEHAFKIVTSHVCNPMSEQLKMYIGGMGGTGKTQVLKAIVEFFNATNQSGRLVVAAPTGTAAALLGGSTYHYLFGFNDRPDDNLPNHLLLQLRARFSGVSYIFLDEVSMLSCHDMYHISLRLSKILNVSDLPFGGINMLFAGDFAQLPPAIGQEHTALYSRTVGTNSTSVRQQEAAIGKALWQQVTTVVILRQNMRQISQSSDDSKLRQALSNMRYKACTAEDIAFL